MCRSALSALAALIAIAFAAPVGAWKGEMASGVRPIAEVQAMAELGDYVTVEGEVVDVQMGNGNVLIVMLRDDSGTVPLRVPNHLQRHFAGGGPKGGSGPDGATPQVGRRARVGGQWNHAYMDDDTWGIRVERAEPLSD